MKILVVVDSINIEDSSGSKANVAFINNLVNAGFDIMVYHYTLKNIQLSGIQCYSIPEIKYSPLYFLSRFQRVVHRKFNLNLSSFFDQFFGFSFTFFNDANSIAKAIKQKTFQPDLILTLSKGASFRPHYALLKLPELHCKWMAYIHDPYPFHYYPRPFSWVESGYKFKDEFFIQVSNKAKYSAFPSLLLKEWMGSYFTNFLNTGVVIPHQNSYYSIKNQDVPQFFDITKFNLLHAGNLLIQRSPKGLLDGFELFLNRNVEAKENSNLFLLGPSSAHTNLFKEYEGNNPNIYINSGYIDFDVIYNLQTKVSVNIILEAKSEISPFLPGKFPHCVSSNKMILSLAPYFNETRRLLGEDYEYWSEVDDVEKIANLIERLYQLWKQNPDNLLLNRKDLEFYLSESYLKNVIIDLNV